MDLLKKVLLIISVVFLCACSKKTDILKGKWTLAIDNNEYVYNFTDENTGTYEVLNEINKFTYEIKKDKITIYFENDQDGTTYKYLLNENSLIFEDNLGIKRVFEKN